MVVSMDFQARICTDYKTTISGNCQWFEKQYKPVEEGSLEIQYLFVG